MYYVTYYYYYYYYYYYFVYLFTLLSHVHTFTQTDGQSRVWNLKFDFKKEISPTSRASKLLEHAIHLRGQHTIIMRPCMVKLLLQLI